MTHKLHTPGPWVWIDNPSGPWPKLVGPDEAPSRLNPTGETGWIAMSADPNSANARLIAAAPDLLAAARRVVRNPNNQHAMDALAKAIHDATGSLRCEHCEGNGYVQCDYDETTPCTHCLDGREVAEQEERT